MKELLAKIQNLLAGYSYTWAIDLLTISLFSFVIWIIWRYITARLLKSVEHTPRKWNDIIIHALRLPISTLIWCWPMLIGVKILLEDVFNKPFDWMGILQSLLFTTLVVWGIFRLVNNVEARLMESSKRDKTTISALSKVVRTIAFVIGGLAAMQSLGLSLSGLLTFGGVGGLVVGLAAKDLLSNFFGGMMIYLDRPFKVGDWVRSPDRNIEGVVEKIGWRMTVVRTFDKRPLYVPNAIFSSIVVENPSRMQNRRINETIGLRYQDGHKMDVIIADVKDMILNHPAIDKRQTIIVNFNSFGASSLDFFIYAFTETVEWVRFHEVKQDVLLEVMKIIHHHGADIAFPTRTLHLQPADVEESETQVSQATLTSV